MNPDKPINSSHPIIHYNQYNQSINATGFNFQTPPKKKRKEIDKTSEISQVINPLIRSDTLLIKKLKKNPQTKQDHYNTMPICLMTAMYDSLNNKDCANLATLNKKQRHAVKLTRINQINNEKTPLDLGFKSNLHLASYLGKNDHLNIDYCQLIRHINLDFSSEQNDIDIPIITEKSIIEVAEKFPKITSLSLSEMLTDNKKKTVEEYEPDLALFKKIIDSFPNLTTLSLTGCLSINDECIKYLTELKDVEVKSDVGQSKTLHLKELRLKNLTELKLEADQIKELDLTNLPLRKLTLVDFGNRSKKKLELSKQFPLKLQEINLKSCENFSNQELDLKKFDNLKVFSIENCEALEIFNLPESLEILNLDSETTNHIQVSHLNKLKSLNLYNYIDKGIFPSSLENLLLSGIDVEYFEFDNILKLKKLNLIKCKIDRPLRFTHQDSKVELTPELQFLEINDCKLEDPSLIDNLINIKKLSLKNWGFGDLSFLNRLCKITELEIINSVIVTEEGFERLQLEHSLPLKSLKKLKMHNVIMRKKSPELNFKKFYPNLQSLDLKNCNLKTQIQDLENLFNLSIKDSTLSKEDSIPSNIKFKTLSHLQKIHIKNSFFNSSEDDNLPKTIKIINFENMIWSIGIKELEQLRILNLKDSTFFDTNFETLTDLEEIKIHNSNIPTVKKFPKKLRIIDFMNSNVHIDVENLTALHTIKIDNCPNSNIIFETLPSLQQVDINNCPQLDLDQRFPLKLKTLVLNKTEQKILR